MEDVELGPGNGWVLVAVSFTTTFEFEGTYRFELDGLGSSRFGKIPLPPTDADGPEALMAEG